MMKDNKANLEPPVDLPSPTMRPEAEVPTEQAPASEQTASVAVEMGISSAPKNLAAHTPGTSAAAHLPSSSQAIPQHLQIPPSSLPAIADDSDLIEKEWVAKAKEIVAHTKNDPYIQNNEMSKVKADYLKKRYNKDLKLST